MIDDARNASSAALVLEGGQILNGTGFGAHGEVVGELCFNTAMSGYQETLSDPSYARQIIVFTYPHIGNVGCNDTDEESKQPKALGCVVQNKPGQASNWRSQSDLSSWMRDHGLIGIHGIDTRDLTRLLRQKGSIKVGLSHHPGAFDTRSVLEKVQAWPGMINQDLASHIGCKEFLQWPSEHCHDRDAPHVVILDFGVKENMARLLDRFGARVTIAPARTSPSELQTLKPDGILLSNGPGDPFATYPHVAECLKHILDHGYPCLGICLGFQLLCLAMGGKSYKLPFGHHGSNHPVMDHQNETVLITAQNHGFAIACDGLPPYVEITHTSLFDQTCEGILVADKKLRGVQYHPEASPGPQEGIMHLQEFVSWLR